MALFAFSFWQCEVKDPVFLGNPIGFFNDITEGVSSLVSEGDVGGLLKSVAHGAANSAAKVSGSLSYGISKATVYDKYNEKRDAFTLRHDTNIFLKFFREKS